MTLKGIFVEIRDWFEHYFINDVPGKIGRAIRKAYWGGRLKKGPNLKMGPGCIFISPENISIGDNANIMGRSYFYANNNGLIQIGERVGINTNVQLGASDSGKIIIGNDVMIGPNSVLRASNHKYEKRDVPIKRQGHLSGEIIVGDNVWIAANVVILPDVTIGKGSVIGAGSVVSRSIPDNVIAAGVPAQVIKNLDQ